MKPAMRPVPLAFGVAIALALIVSAADAPPPKVEQLTLKVVKADSEETAGEDGRAANAVDGNPDTIWHTEWQDASPTHPHEIVIELQPVVSVKGLTYLPRQDDNDHGSIREYEVYLSLDGKDFGKPVRTGTFAAGKEKKTIVFKPARAAFVKLVAKSALRDAPWTSAAEIGIVQEGEKVTPDTELSVVKADSEETAGEDGKAANAIDGDPATYWHTQWQDDGPGHPHEIVLKLDPAMKVKGLTYLPRQNEDNDNGTIADYEVYVSADGKDWGQPVAKGTFDHNKQLKTVSFDPKEAAFVKLVAKSEVNGNPWTSAAEIRVIPAEQ